MNIYYNSRNPHCKEPFGAISTGECCRFRVFFSGKSRPDTILLHLWMDGQREHTVSLNFSDGAFEGMAVLSEPGCYFYYFSIEQDEQCYFIKKSENGDAVLSDSDSFWQLTVYRNSFSVPDFLKGGILYQIFPDRFAVSGKTKQNVPTDRILRKDKEGDPFFLPDENGKVLNNDYFGGDLEGIRKQLKRLKQLSVSCIYLNPIFEAHSNHRYNVADYYKIDPLLGTLRDFKRLCRTAHRMGIRILLDGVFSHTGDDSIYFNRTGRYPSLGAYQSKDSPYYRWYSFLEHPDRYDSWWGFETLPNVREMEPSYLAFICGRGGVIEYWLKKGADGFRLDVADELPDEFIKELRTTIKRTKRNALLLGEVWEDASHKESYGIKRKYLLGDELDSVMNYPFRNAILALIQSGDRAAFEEKITSICENYPPLVLHNLMNFLSTHDTERILTALSDESCEGKDRLWQSQQRLSPQAYPEGISMVRLAFTILYLLPGVPCIYYGDELGMQGYKDPFNRRFYGTQGNDLALKNFLIRLGKLRKDLSLLKQGSLKFQSAPDGILLFSRNGKRGNAVLLAANFTSQPKEFACNHPLLFCSRDGKPDSNLHTLAPFEARIFKIIR